MSGRSEVSLFAVPPPAPAEARGPSWPLWMVFVAGVLTGVIILVGAVGSSFGQTPRLAAGSILLFGAFGGACTLLLNRIPYFCPVGRQTRVLAALWGGTAAAGYALLANISIYESFVERGVSGWSLFTPFTEEPLKDLGIVVVLLLAATRPRTALDGLVVGSFVGLGFEVVEDVVQSINNAIASAAPGDPENWGSLVVDVVHEVVRRSWTGHIVLTGIAGFGIAYAMTVRHRSGMQRWGVAAALVLVALAGHLLWNSHRFGLFYVLGQFAVLGLYLWLIRVGRAQEAAVYVPYLSYAPIVDPALAASMHSAKSRRAYRSSGSCSAKRQRAVARLAAAIANGDVPAAQRSAAQVAI